MVPAGFENAGVPGSSPGVAIEDDERTTQPCAHRAWLCSLLEPVTEETATSPRGLHRSHPRGPVKWTANILSWEFLSIQRWTVGRNGATITTSATASGGLDEWSSPAETER